MFHRLWRTFRLAFLIVLFIGLGAYLFLTTPWARYFGKPPTYKKLIAEGTPIAAAIEQFHADCNLWPEYLDDLVPRYLPHAPAPRWYYTLTPNGPSLATPTPEPHTNLGYLFESNPPHWQLFGDKDTRILPSSPAPSLPPQPASRPSPGARLANELAELHRRIGREPHQLEHRQGLISLLRSLHHTADARAALAQAATEFPDSFWPPLATAALEETPAATDAFARWVDAHPSFTHFYYLSRLYVQQHAPQKARAAIAAALHQPMELDADDPDILAFYFWDMTRTALAIPDQPLALELTDAWRKAADAHLLDENSDLPLRAAAELSLGHDAAAQAALRTLDAKHLHPSSLWAQHLPTLRAAVARRDHSFQYDPGPTPPPYPIFQLPQ